MPMYTNMYSYSKWSEFEFISCVAKKFGVNRRWVQEWCQQMDKLQKLKNNLYVVLVGKTFHLITNIYIRVQFLFSKRGACFYWVPCFYWDIYGILDIDSHCPYLLSGETTFQLTSCSNSLHVYLRFGETTSHLTSKWRGTFQYFQSHDEIPYYLEKPPPI